jgi:LCP family protein required for cell wall assembly
MVRTPEALASADRLVPRPPTRLPCEPEIITPVKRVRRAVTLLVLTVVVPGSAQIVAGNRRLGRIALRFWVGVLAVAAFVGLLALTGRSVLLTLATSAAALALVSLALFVGGVCWPLLVVDAWRLGRPQLLPRRSRIGVSALALALVLATGVPMMGAGRRAWAAADFIHGVFGSGYAAKASHGRFNILLMGGDAGPDRVGTRPDSMTLVSIDADTGRTVLFSLPRNLENVYFAPGSSAARAMPRGWNCGDECLLNGVYMWGQQHKALFPEAADPGAAAMKQAVSGVTGLDVPYYVLIDLRGFRDLIDAMGGIELTVNARVPIGGGTSPVSGYIEPGRRRLDGYHALWYARSRHNASDYERMARQRCVMDSMLHQLDPTTVFARFQAIAAAGRNVVSTDLPAGELGTFVDLAVKARSQRVSSVQFVPPLINPARPDMTLIRQKVSSAIEASERAVHGNSGSSGRSSSGSSSASPSASASPAAQASDVAAVCSPG